jgi:uroporphyrinogen decarboxylase
VCSSDLERAGQIIETGKAAKGHIFNLGHGVIPSTNPDQLAKLTEFVQSYPIAGPIAGPISGPI